MRLSNAEQPLPAPEKRFERPTPWQIRDEFHRLMREELVGPKDGEDEGLWSQVESHASNRYVLEAPAPMNMRRHWTVL